MQLIVPRGDMLSFNNNLDASNFDKILYLWLFFWF
jgi:hypothetical protein